MGIGVNNANKYPDLFETDKFFVVYVHQSSFGFFVEAAKFEDEFFLGGGGECNTKKSNIERGSRVDQKFDFLNCCSDGRSETVDAKISSKRDHFTIHMLDSEVG
jgi:hypothetical protein